MLFKRKPKEKEKIAGRKPASKKGGTKLTAKKTGVKKPTPQKKAGKIAAHKPLPKKKVGQTARKNASVKLQKRTTPRKTAPAKKTGNITKIKVDKDTGWEYGQLTGDSARFNKFVRMARENGSTVQLRNELKKVGLNEKGISAVWNTDSIYGPNVREQGQDLMSIFNNPEYRSKQNETKPRIRAGEFANINAQSAHGHLGIVTKRYKNGKMDAVTATDSEKYPKHKKIKLEENPDPKKRGKTSYLNKRIHKGVTDKDIGTRRPTVRIKNPIDKSKLRKLKTEAKRIKKPGDTERIGQIAQFVSNGGAKHVNQSPSARGSKTTRPLLNRKITKLKPNVKKLK